VIYVVAALMVKPERRAELIAGAGACVAETRKEAGNIAYDMHQSVTNPTKMVFVERWESHEAIAAHESSAHVKTFLGIVAKCLVARPKIEIITPAKVDVR
jgi:quinol monooxygenase YgiN